MEQRRKLKVRLRKVTDESERLRDSLLYDQLTPKEKKDTQKRLENLAKLRWAFMLQLENERSRRRRNKTSR